MADVAYAPATPLHVPNVSAVRSSVGSKEKLSGGSELGGSAGGVNVSSNPLERSGRVRLGGIDQRLCRQVDLRLSSLER